MIVSDMLWMMVIAFYLIITCWLVLVTVDSAAPKDDSADIVEYEDDFEPDDTGDDDGQLSLHNLNFSFSA